MGFKGLGVERESSEIPYLNEANKQTNKQTNKDDSAKIARLSYAGS